MPTSSKARRTLDRTARSTMASAAPAAAASSTTRPTRISLSVNEPAPTQHTGATPRMQAIRIPSSGEYSDFTLSPTGGKSPRPPDMPSAEEVEKKVARTSSAGDAASSSRNASRHASIDENSREAMLAMLATGEDGEGDDDSSDDEEGESLARMMRLRQQKASPAPGSRSSPRLRPSSRSSPAGPIALMAGASSAAAATSTPTPAAKATSETTGGEGEPEDGFESVVGSASRRRSSRGTPQSTTAGGGPATPGTPTRTPTAAASTGGGGGDDDSSGDEVYGAYSAAKDASRRKIGKHGRNIKQSVQRGYSIEARQAQRSGNR